MTFSPRNELDERAKKITQDKLPEKSSVKEFIDIAREARKEVFDGYGEAYAYGKHKPIRTMEDVNNCANAMAFIDGHYPVGMSVCYTVGINGDCGINCPQFKAGDCENETTESTRQETQLAMEHDGWDEEDIKDLLDCYYGEEE